MIALLRIELGGRREDDAVFGEHQIRPCLRGRSSRWRVWPDRH